MVNSSFWLIHADNSYITVGLCQIVDGRPNLTSLGQPFPWTSLEPDSFITAVDESLSQASTLIGLPADEEPSSSAFIVSPFWLDAEGKITSNYLKLIESACKKLDLKPMGFISNDEAILESSPSNEGLPSSFVLVYLTPTSFDVSLIYLGKIRERSHHELSNSFTPNDLEVALASLNTDSTLPPQIIVFGSYEQTIIDSLKNYSWVGKKNIETFLHFPDVVAYSQSDVFTIFLKVISSQFIVPSQDNSSTPIEQPTVQESPQIESEPIQLLDVVDPESIGFSPVTSPVIEPETSTPPLLPDFTATVPKKNFVLPKIVLPKIHIPLKLPILLLALSPLIVVSLFLLAKVEITLSVTPYTLEAQKNVTLDYSDSPDASSIPVKQKTVTSDIKASTVVTGQKTVGEKSIGEVVIFNQFSSPLNLKKGDVLTSETGLKFELTTNVQVVASSADYDTGIITMGQTRANVIATEIGEEYNLGKDQKMFVKESGGAQILAKVKENLSGGSKRQIQAVSAEDKASVDREIAQKMSSPTNLDLNSTPGILPNTLLTKNQRVEYNRQVGEESETLEAESKTSISIYYLEDINKSTIINQFFKDNSDLTSSSFSVSDFTFDFTPDKSSTDKTKGVLVVKGFSTPKIDTVKLSTLLVGKTPSQVKKIITSFSNRINDYTTSPKTLIMPLVKKNIIIKIK